MASGSKAKATRMTRPERYVIKIGGALAEAETLFNLLDVSVASNFKDREAFPGIVFHISEYRMGVPSSDPCFQLPAHRPAGERRLSAGDHVFQREESETGPHKGGDQIPHIALW